jgi:hypothetical protein
MTNFSSGKEMKTANMIVATKGAPSSEKQLFAFSLAALSTTGNNVLTL